MHLAPLGIHHDKSRLLNAWYSSSNSFVSISFVLLYLTIGGEGGVIYGSASMTSLPLTIPPYAILLLPACECFSLFFVMAKTNNSNNAYTIIKQFDMRILFVFIITWNLESLLNFSWKWQLLGQRSILLLVYTMFHMFYIMFQIIITPISSVWNNYQCLYINSL